MFQKDERLKGCIEFPEPTDRVLKAGMHEAEVIFVCSGLGLSDIFGDVAG